MAGVSGMPYRRFLSFSVFGSFGWILVMTQLGYHLGKVEFVRRHFDQAVLLIIFVSLLPTLSEAWKAWRSRSRNRPEAPAETAREEA
jgi:membrane-associated protein